MTFATIKQQVLATLATSSTAAVKQWAEQHGITADLRTKGGWLAVLSAIAQFTKEQAIASLQSAAETINNADAEQINDTVCDTARALKVAAVDGAIATYDTLKQHWTPVIRFSWAVTRFTVIWLAIAAIYCLRAGQRVRGFVNEFEDTDMSPQAIAWYFCKPVMGRVRGAWELAQERAIGLAAQRRVRETAI